jgi:hypothetical protein
MSHAAPHLVVLPLFLPPPTHCWHPPRPAIRRSNQPALNPVSDTILSCSLILAFLPLHFCANHVQSHGLMEACYRFRRQRPLTLSATQGCCDKVHRTAVMRCIRSPGLQTGLYEPVVRRWAIVPGWVSAAPHSRALHMPAKLNPGRRARGNAAYSCCRITSLGSRCCVTEKLARHSATCHSAKSGT